MSDSEPHPRLLWGVAALGAETHYILIDRSDLSNFKHTADTRLTMKKASGYILGNTGVTGFVIKWGVIMAFATTVSSTIKWFATKAGIAVGQSLDMKDILHMFPITPDLDLVAAGGTLLEVGNTDYRDTITTHKTPFDAVGSTIKPALGDIVMSVYRTAGDIDLDLALEYSSE